MPRPSFRKTHLFLGLDPGTTRMGYGLIKKEVGKLTLVACGATEIKERGPVQHLLALEKKLEQLIKDYTPDAAGVEKLYFAKNKKTAIEVSQARGVMLLSLGRAKIPVLEFDPTDIKRAVAGDGHCDKRVLARMVCLTLGEESLPGPDDVSDALAVAIRTSFEW